MTLINNVALKNCSSCSITIHVASYDQLSSGNNMIVLKRKASQYDSVHLRNCCSALLILQHYSSDLLQASVAKSCTLFLKSEIILHAHDVMYDVSNSDPRMTESLEISKISVICSEIHTLELVTPQSYPCGY